MTPQLWVFAGPNGAGKSTLVDRYVADRVRVVNPDNIARSLTGANVQRIVATGRLAIAERQRLLAARETFAIETTLAGKSELDLMRAAASAGYKVSLVFLGLADVSYSIARVRGRVASGGHDVPLDDLLRRFARSLGNLPTAMMLADRVLLFDNTDTRRQLLLSRERGRVRFRTSNPPEWARGFLHP